MTSVGWFWLMVMALFADCDEYRKRVFLAPGGLLLIGIIYQMRPVPEFMHVIGALAQVGLAVASLMIVVRSWKGDLVESRRRVRGRCGPPVPGVRPASGTPAGGSPDGHPMSANRGHR